MTQPSPSHGAKHLALFILFSICLAFALTSTTTGCSNPVNNETTKDSGTPDESTTKEKAEEPKQEETAEEPKKEEPTQEETAEEPKQEEPSKNDAGPADDIVKEDPPKDEPTQSQDQMAFVISRQGQTGAFGTIDTKTQTAKAQLGSIHSDAFARYWNGYIFAINKLGADNIQVMNAKDFSLVKQYSTDAKSNPYDIAIVDKNKAYISRYALASILIVEPLTGKKLGEVDLTDLVEVDETKTCAADNECSVSKKCVSGKCARDGIPEAGLMHLYKDKLFVLIQRLDRNQQFKAFDGSYIAVIDTTTDKVIKKIKTKAQNPTSLFVGSDPTKLYVGETGNFSKPDFSPDLDGYIEVLDLEKQEFTGTVLSEQELGGNIGGFVIAGTTGYVIRTNAKFQTEVISFDTSTQKVGKTVVSAPCTSTTDCYTFSDIAYNKVLGEFYIADGLATAPGVRIFDGATGTEKTTKPIDMKLPPASIFFYPVQP